MHSPVLGCAYHKHKPAMTVCALCGMPICQRCAQAGPSGFPICRPCCVEQGIKQKRSGDVTTLSILSIVFGGLALALAVLSLVSILSAARSSGAGSSGWDFFYLAFWGVCGSVQLPLIASGIGMLSLRNWARTGSIVCAILILLGLAVLLGLFMHYSFAGRTAYGGWYPLVVAAMFLVLIIALPYPIVLLSCLTRPFMKVQFGYRLSGAEREKFLRKQETGRAR